MINLGGGGEAYSAAPLNIAPKYCLAMKQAQNFFLMNLQIV